MAHFFFAFCITKTRDPLCHYYVIVELKLWQGLAYQRAQVLTLSLSEQT